MGEIKKRVRLEIIKSLTVTAIKCRQNNKKKIFDGKVGDIEMLTGYFNDLVKWRKTMSSWPMAEKDIVNELIKSMWCIDLIEMKNVGHVE